MKKYTSLSVDICVIKVLARLITICNKLQTWTSLAYVDYLAAFVYWIYHKLKVRCSLLISVDVLRL